MPSRIRSLVGAAAVVGLALLYSAELQAQTIRIPASEMTAALRKDGMGRLSAGDGVEARFWTASVPVTFSRLVQDDAKEWRMGPEMALGGSYLYMVGQGVAENGGGAQVTPKFFTGPTMQAGFAEDPNDETLAPSILLGWIIGFSHVATLVGYDFLEGSVAFGIGSKVGTVTTPNVVGVRRF